MYIYIYIHTQSLYVSGLDGPLWGHTDRLDGPFHKEGKGRERMEQEWERVNKER